MERISNPVKWNNDNKRKSCFLLKCDGSHLSSQWYPPCCPLSVQPISFKRRAYQMGFSLNSLEAKDLKSALQRDSSVSEITLNQNCASNLTNCSQTLQIWSGLELEISWYCLFSKIFLLVWLVKHFFFWLFQQNSSMTSGSPPDMRTEGGEGGWKDARQRTGGDGGSGQIPSSPVCVWVTSQRDAAAQKGGYLYLSHSDISCRCWFLWGSNYTFLNGTEL